MVDYFQDLLNEKALVASTLIAASAYLLKVWGESKRDARYVLYLLMDLRKSLLGYRVQMNKAGAPMADTIADEIKKMGGDVPAEELEKAKQQLEGFMSGLSSILFDYQHQLFAERFENGLTDLARRSPLRAFRIRSHRLMVEVAASQEKLLSQLFDTELKPQIDASEAPAHEKAAALKAFEEVLSEERLSNIDGFIKAINSDMRWLAWSCGPFTWVRILWRLYFSKVDTFISSIDRKDLAEFFGRVDSRAKAILKAQTSQD
jgi:hypothetical protein